MTQPEAKLSRKIMDALRKEGYFCYKVWGNEMTPAGMPDIVCCAEGRFVGLETKMPKERGNVSKVQLHRHEEIRKAGGDVFVVCSPEEAVSVVRGALA